MKVVEHAVQLGRQRYNVKGLTRNGVDEFCRRKLHVYLTVVYDPDHPRLLRSGPGKSKAALSQFFKEMYAEWSKEQKVITIDMNPACEHVVAFQVPRTTLVLTNFTS